MAYTGSRWLLSVVWLPLLPRTLPPEIPPDRIDCCSRMSGAVVAPGARPTLS
jgi:hypothetical protein